MFSDLPEDAHILCVGAGTGAELIYLAGRFPQWRFTVVEPSAAMLEVCRRRAGEQGIAPRCHLHQGYVEALDRKENFDAATTLLVSQFILEREARAEFFRTIARRLRPGGMLANSDLASDTDSTAHQRLLEVWLQMMRAGGIPPEGLERMRVAYGRDVACCRRGRWKRHRVRRLRDAKTVLTGRPDSRLVCQAGVEHRLRVSTAAPGSGETQR